MRYRGRGRPKTARPSKDLGTKELQSKRRLHQTEERLDRYLRLELINSDQHWCGNHFRWLHATRYGAPTITSSFLIDAQASKMALSEKDAIRYELKYRQAMEVLMSERLERIAIDNLALPNGNLGLGYAHEKNKLLRVLDILVDLWR